MILSGNEIARQVAAGQITIQPFSKEYCNPNSYNFHLGSVIKIYEGEVLDPRFPNNFLQIDIPPEGLLLMPDQLYLGHIAEKIGSNYFVPMIKGISSVARLGLFINITADLIDQGAFGCWTLQMHAVQPLRVYAGMPIGQMTFWLTDGAPMLYEGKYQNSTGPMQSLSYNDPFFKR